GVRVVTPIHADDNALGGAAAFIGPYNWLNDLMHRGILDATKEDLNKYAAKFFQIKEETCSAFGTANDGECVQLRLEWDKQNRLYIGKCIYSGFRSGPCLQQVKVPSYHTLGGHKNQMGLTLFGKEYVTALMDEGMIIDTAHMSDASVEATFALIVQRVVQYHP